MQASPGAPLCPSRTGEEAGHLTLNPFTRVTPEHAVHGWSASAVRLRGIHVHPGLLLALRELPWPMPAAELAGAFARLGYAPPESLVESLESARILVRLGEHGSNLARLKGAGKLDLSPFLMNQYSIEYFRAALRLGLQVVAQDPATLEITGSDRRHVIRYAELATLDPEAAADLSQRKELCTQRWRALGLPVPRELVLARERLQEAPAHVGFPLVIKPIQGAMGLGVFANVNSGEEIARIQAFFAAGPQAREHLLVQTCVPGTDHRLLVVGGRMIAAARRICPFVLGDGVSTLRQLIPSPTVGEKFSFTEPGTLEALRVQGFTPETVLPRGGKALLNHKANTCTGGFSVDATEAIHPTVQAAACRAAEAIGLQVAGVDFICEDAALPLAEGKGCLIEINTRPGVVESHIYPSLGRSRGVCDEILRFMFGLPAPAL